MVAVRIMGLETVNMVTIIVDMVAIVVIHSEYTTGVACPTKDRPKRITVATVLLTAGRITVITVAIAPVMGFSAGRSIVNARCVASERARTAGREAT